MVRYSTNTASRCFILLSAIMFSRFLAGGAAAQDNTNTRLGTGALQNNTTGSLNTAIGFEALRDNTEGNSNTAIGVVALQNNARSSYTRAADLVVIGDVY